jgi:hypothetical protein
MRTPRSILITMLVALAILAGAWFTYSYRSSRQEEMQIRARYQQIRLALSAGDTNVARSLFAPDIRADAHRNFDRLSQFAKQLGPQSSVRFSSSKAQVCPERIFHYRILPGGHTIEMVKVDGEWFFTGKVHID